MSATRAWMWLIGLSLLSTLAAAGGLSGRGLALGVLVLAWLKARLILNQYLRLAQAPALAQGFGMALALLMAVLLGLAVAAP